MSEVVRLDAAYPIGRSAVVLTKGAIGLHAGIYYRSDDQTCRVLHLAWHYKLHTDDDLRDWLVVLPLIDPLELQILAGLCHVLNERRPAIPYGLHFGSSRFDNEGRFVPGTGESGLTCTTFVMAIFDWANLPLLLRESWKVRDEDIVAQGKLVEFLRRDATPEHVKAVELEVGSLRFRSEEAAAATGFLERPVTFEEAATAGCNVRASCESLQ